MVIENSQIERSKTTIFRYKTGYKGRATTVVGFGEIFVVCSDPEWLDMKGSLISALFHDRCAVSESCGAQFTWCDHTCAVYRQILVIIALRYRSTYHLYCSTRKKLTVDTCFLVFVRTLLHAERFQVRTCCVEHSCVKHWLGIYRRKQWKYNSCGSAVLTGNQHAACWPSHCKSNVVPTFLAVVRGSKRNRVDDNTEKKCIKCRKRSLCKDHQFP